METEKQTMQNFIYLKDPENSWELFIAVEHVTTVELNTIRNPSQPTVAIHFAGGSLIELSEVEGRQFLEAAGKMGITRDQAR
jgi:hypothetical protein